MSDQTMFDENKQDEIPATPENAPQDPFADLLSGIRNEQGEPKYKDVASALNGLRHSQEYITQLKRELTELQDKHTNTESELQRMKTIEEYVERIRPTNPPANDPKPETPNVENGLSEEKIAQLLEQRLNARDQESVKVANLKAVVDKLTETHGEAAAEFIKTRAKELNTTPEELKNLAMSNPALALSALGAGQGKAPATPTHSTNFPPREIPNENPMPKWDKSVVHGGLTNKQLAERWREAQAYTHKRLGVKS